VRGGENLLDEFMREVDRFRSRKKGG